MTILKGQLEFYSETGTEGGYWAFQDEQYTTKEPIDWGLWPDRTYYDRDNPNRSGKVISAEVCKNGEWFPLPDPIQDDPLYFASSLFRGQNQGDREADQQLAEKYGFELEYNDQSYGTPKTTPYRPYGAASGEPCRCIIKWDDGETEERQSDSLLQLRQSYDGLHVLATGDKLTIYDKEAPARIIWSGTIKLNSRELFTEDAFGYWIHNDMEGWNREDWAKLFLGAYPAQLEIADKVRPTLDKT